MQSINTLFQHSLIKKDYLSLLLLEFDLLKTWTARKKILKKEIKMEVDRLQLQKIAINKNKFQLSRFGQTKIVDSTELINDFNSPLLSQKIQLICLEPEHCVFFWIAVREV
jgi:hypothetical protein